MKIKIDVEIYSASGKRTTVEEILTDDDLRTLAENKVLADYTCDSCAAKSIEVITTS